MEFLGKFVNIKKQKERFFEIIEEEAWQSRRGW
jgi:hypothetical protein